MLTARYPRAAKTFSRKEYSVNLTVLPWLRIATGSVIIPAFACGSLSRRTAMPTPTGRFSRGKKAQAPASKAKAEWQFRVSCSSSANHPVGPLFQCSRLCGPLSLIYVIGAGKEGKGGGIQSAGAGNRPGQL